MAKLLKFEARLGSWTCLTCMDGVRPWPGSFVIALENETPAAPAPCPRCGRAGTVCRLVAAPSVSLEDALGGAPQGVA